MKIPRQLLERQVRRLYDIADGVPLADLAEPLRSYAAYAMNTVERGRWALEELRPHGLAPGFRFLDAGCAYGGFLAAAVELGAREVVGIELAERYLEIARELLATTGIGAELVEGSLSDPAVLAPLGRFDLITCADVIEHVDDPAATLANLAAALAPGGLLYLAVPNFRSPAWVRQDPHFQWFGITLLPPAEAREYCRRVSGSDYYDVGEYHELGWYRDRLQEAGLTVELINRPRDQGRALDELRQEVERLALASARFADPRLAEGMVADLRQRADALVAALRAALEAGRPRRWRILDRRPAVDLLPLIDDYGVQTWHLLGRRG